MHPRSGAHSSPYCQARFNIQRCTVHCSGTHTVLQLLCLFKYSFSFLDQCLTHTPQPGHPPGCVQNQGRAWRGYSVLTGSCFQAGSFASSLRATLCLCLSLQSLLQALTRCLCSPALPLTCFIAKDFPRKLRRRVRNSAHKRDGCLNLPTETAYFCWSSRVMQSVLKAAVFREGQQVFCLIMLSINHSLISDFPRFKEKIRNKKHLFVVCVDQS